MTPEQITENKRRFEATCREYIHREGLEKLLEYLEKSDFYTAPSSTGFHLNEEGGLCQHSLNVFEVACAISEHIVCPAIDKGTAPFGERPDKESIAIATLFHDLCKIDLYHRAERWKKVEGRWESYTGYEIVDTFPFGHGEKSCFRIERCMRLKPDELLAIRWHMGMFEATEPGSITRFAYRKAMGVSPLVSLLQAADMVASNCLEKTTPA